MRQIIEKCFKTAHEKGWWDRYDELEAKDPELFKTFLPDIIGGKLMLMVSELAETLEEVRVGKDPREIYYTVKKLNGERTVVTDLRPYQHTPEELKPEGIPIELADVIIRIFDFAGWFNIDLARAVEIKMNYNETRPKRHGGKTL